MRVKFLVDYQVQSAKGTAYRKGQVIDLSDDAANHFITRGIVEPHDSKKEKDEGKKD